MIDRATARRAMAQEAARWFAIVTVSVAGIALLLVAEAHGAPAWMVGAYALTCAVALLLYRFLVVPSMRELEARHSATRSALDHLGKALEHVRAGDLVHAGREASDVPGRAGASLAGAIGALEVIAQRIQGGSTDVAGAATAVNRIAAELASASSEQAASVVEITAAMEELARTAGQIADSARAQAELAERGEQIGHRGASAVADAVSGVEQVRERIASIAGRAEALDVSAREIFRVLDLITHIARETHLLSLNAAIEAAAETGESGRRFSLVADEVRRLAQRAQESANSVRSLLDDFGASVRATVVATAEGGGQAAQVLEHAQAGALAIDDLRAAAVAAAGAAREVSSATHEQEAAAGEVVATLREASSVVQQIAEGLRRFSETSGRLQALGLDTQLMAQTLRLASDHSLKHVVENWLEVLRPRLGNWSAIEGLLEDFVVRLPYVECVYYYETDGGRTMLVVNRQILGDRSLPTAVMEGIGFTERPWYKMAVASGRAVLTPPYESTLSHELIVVAAVPALQDGRLLGVLGLDVNVDAWTRA
ncbi:MAG: methyl-accepting chemotaxis protein [Acidobacteriota bacterium]